MLSIHRGILYLWSVCDCQRSTINGTDDYGREDSDEAFELSSDVLLLPSLSSSQGQSGQVEPPSLHHQSHGRGRRRISKDGIDTQSRRTKEREPPPHWSSAVFTVTVQYGISGCCPLEQGLSLLRIFGFFFFLKCDIKEELNQRGNLIFSPS